MMNNSFTPDKHIRVRRRAEEKRIDPKKPQESFTIYCFSIFKKTSSFWITFTEPVNPLEIEKKLCKAFNLEAKIYTSGDPVFICMIELPEPLSYKHISKTVKGALLYSR